MSPESRYRYIRYATRADVRRLAVEGAKFFGLIALLFIANAVYQKSSGTHTQRFTLFYGMGPVALSALAVLGYFVIVFLDDLGKAGYDNYREGRRHNTAANSSLPD